MIFEDKRLEQLAQMFLATLQFIEENDPSQGSWEDRRRYLAEVIRSSIESSREAEIQSLQQQLGHTEERLAAAAQVLQAQHEQELAQLKTLYEEEIARITAKSKALELHIKKHIETRMKDLEKDYILRVLHQQEVKRALQQAGASSDLEPLKAELQKLQAENQELRHYIKSMRTPDRSEEAFQQTESKKRFASGSRGSASIKWLDEQTANENQKGTPPRKNVYNKRASNTNGFDKSDPAPETNLHSELERIRTNLQAKHYRLMKTSSDQQEKSRHLNRNQSTNLLKAELNEQSTQENAESSGDRQILSHALSSEDLKVEAKLELSPAFDKTKASPSSQQHRIFNSKQLRNPHFMAQSRKQKQSAYTFKYLNLKL